MDARGETEKRFLLTRKIPHKLSSLDRSVLLFFFSPQTLDEMQMWLDVLDELDAVEEKADIGACDRSVKDGDARKRTAQGHVMAVMHLVKSKSDARKIKVKRRLLEEERPPLPVVGNRRTVKTFAECNLCEQRHEMGATTVEDDDDDNADEVIRLNGCLACPDELVLSVLRVPGLIRPDYGARSPVRIVVVCGGCGGLHDRGHSHRRLPVSIVAKVRCVIEDACSKCVR